MHERGEIARHNEVEGFIRSQDNRFSDGDPLLAEDLEQEAREALDFCSDIKWWLDIYSSIGYNRAVHHR